MPLGSQPKKELTSTGLYPPFKMSELLNSYTFEAKKIVYYSVTVGANSKAEARRIASDFEHCQHYEEVEYVEGDEYKVGKLLETTQD